MVIGLRKALRDFTPVEIFRGESINAGKYSILLRCDCNLMMRHCATITSQTACRGKFEAALQELGGVQRA